MACIFGEMPYVFLHFKSMEKVVLCHPYINAYISSAFGLLLIHKVCYMAVKRAFERFSKQIAFYLSAAQ